MFTGTAFAYCTTKFEYGPTLPTDPTQINSFSSCETTKYFEIAFFFIYSKHAEMQQYLNMISKFSMNALTGISDGPIYP